MRDANNKLLRKTTTDASGFKDLTVYFGAVELHYTAASPNASVTSYYLFGGQRVAMNKDGTLTYLHGDHLGSASMATDGSGTVLNEGAFKPFGEPLGSSTFANDRTFTGQRFDSATGGLMDYNARFYSPVLGRFVSADSIVPGAGNPQGLNRYAYVFNNPLKFVDPDGHDPKDDNGNSTNTCAYGYGCNTFEMGVARSYQTRTNSHYSPRSSAAHQTQAQTQLNELRENDKSILLVPAVTCAIAAPCGLAAINTAMVAGGHYASLSKGAIIAVTGPQLPKNAIIGFAGELAGQILEMAWGKRESGDFSFSDMIVSTGTNIGTGAVDNFIKPIGYAQRIRTALPKAAVATGISYPTSTNPKNDLQMNVAVEYSAVILQITLESNGVSEKRAEFLAESYKVGINRFIKYFQPKDK